VTGAATENTTAQNNAHTEPTPAGLQIENALALWTQNQKDQAANALRQIDWSQPMHFSPDSYAFTLTEKELASLDPMTRSNLVNDIMTVNGHFRALARHLVSLGQTALAQGDAEKAQTYLQTVCHFGQVITGDADTVVTVRMVGFAVTQQGLRELITFYNTQTNNQEQLQWAQQELQKVQTESQNFKESILKE